MIFDAKALTSQGVEALRRGDARAARTAFDRVEHAGLGNHQLRLLLAQACTILDDRPAAHRALDQVLAEEPGNLYALVMRGDLLMRDQDPRAAVAWYQAALTHAPRLGQLPPDLVQTLRRAEQAVAHAATLFHGQLQAGLRTAGIEPEKAGPRFTEALEILSGRAQIQLQRPTSFYYPGLPQRAFFDPADFAWTSGLTAQAAAIRDELLALGTDDPAFTPYVVAEENRPTKRHPLLEDASWSALHLYRKGMRVADNADRCPTTMAALERVPIPVIAGRSPMAMFSALRPGTHIPPHNGMLNTRLICHLPLIVPPGCRLRVGNETRPVEQDQVMIFDDSIEHEAWNDGDALRVVLLFEVWRPELAPSERDALTALFETIGSFGASEEDQAGA